MSEQKYELLPVHNMNDLALTGKLLQESCMFGAKTEGAGLVIAITCFMQRITPLDFMRTYHLIENKPSMRSDAMAAEFRKRGGKIKIITRDETKAEAEFEFEGSKQVFSYSIKDAEKEGVCFKSKTDHSLKDNWQFRPKNMLWARLISDSIRALCPEIVAGIYTPEEVMDFDDVTQQREEKVVDPSKINLPKASKPKENKAPVEQVMKDAEVAIDIKAEEIKESPPATQDPNLCPMSPMVGKPFKEMTTEDLTALSEVYCDNPKLTDDHLKIIRAELEERRRGKK